MLRPSLTIFFAILSNAAFAQNSEVSIAKGDRIAIIGGCHDCHTAGYAESNGIIDPATALTGNPVGYQGPWGTTYAANLRIVADTRSEDEFVAYLSTLETKPPMPWFNVHHFDDAEMRSLHQYIVSLGEPGEPAPTYVPPDGTVTTPFVIFAPPSIPTP